MSEAVKIPPYDPELSLILESMPPFPGVDADSLEMLKTASAGGIAQVADDLETYQVRLTEHVIDGPRGEIPLISIAPKAGAVGLPAIYFIHGGGMILGDRYSTLTYFHLIEWVEKHNLVVVSVDYRMAPEFPGLAAVEDCAAGLVWTAQSADLLGIDPDRIILAGPSGGGGLAAGTALLNRDTGGPALLAQILWCPQVDDRSDFVSAEQYQRTTGAVSWTREDHRYTWDLILGEGHENRDDISIYAAANRAHDLGGLPPAFIDVGSSELFRDPAVHYASKLWAAGVQAELHVWAGGCHGFDVLFQHLPVSAASIAVREGWLRRILDQAAK